LNVYKKGLDFYTYDQSPYHYTQAFIDLLPKLKDKDFLLAYETGLEKCRGRRACYPFEFTKTFSSLAELVSKPQLAIYQKRIPKSKHPISFTDLFCHLVKPNKLTDSQLRFRLTLFESRKEEDSHDIRFPRVFVEFMDSNPTDRQLAIFVKAFKIAKRSEQNPAEFIIDFQKLIKAGLTDQQLIDYVHSLEKFVNEFSHRNCFTKIYTALAKTKISNQALEGRLDIYKKILKQNQRFNIRNDYSAPSFLEWINLQSNNNRWPLLAKLVDLRSRGGYFALYILLKKLNSLLQVESKLPSVVIAIRNLDKAIDKSLVSAPEEVDPAINNILTIVYAELDRRGLQEDKMKIWPVFGSEIANYPGGNLDEHVRQIGEVYDFGLDVFHGFETLTQAARPIRKINQPQNSLLERCLTHLAQNSYRLNCSQEGHMDFKFPGISWLYEKFKIPQVKKEILNKIKIENLYKVGILTNKFDDLEASDIAVMRGGLILSNPSIQLRDSFGGRERYSLVMYNDHFDNPTNTPMLLVPTYIIEEKLAEAKVKLAAYKGYNKSLPDILGAGLDAHSLLQQRGVINLLSGDTLRGGFASYNNPHSDAYEAVALYKSIWRKLQLAMSLYNKGFVDEPINTKQLRPEFSNGFNRKYLLLNEIYNWREWYLNNEKNKADTPVLIDCDPFRYSDARHWTLKLDPAAKDGIELSIKGKQDEPDKTIVLPDRPTIRADEKAWLQDVKDVWDSEVYAKVYNRYLTKDLKFFNRAQIAA